MSGVEISRLIVAVGALVIMLVITLAIAGLVLFTAHVARRVERALPPTGHACVSSGGSRDRPMPHCRAGTSPVGRVPRCQGRTGSGTKYTTYDMP